MKSLFNISNSLSLLRILLSIPLAYFILFEQITAVLIVSFIAIITDYLDGLFARKLNQITDLGKILDPLADKIFVGTATILMVLKGFIPEYFAIILVARDVLIFLGGIYIKNKTGIVPSSNMTGKITINIVSLVIIGILLEIDGFYTYGSLIASMVLVYSFIIYVIRAYKILKTKSENF